MRKSTRTSRHGLGSHHLAGHGWARQGLARWGMPGRGLPGRGSARRRSARGGFTLLEVLIATAVTLLMMISLAQVFKVVGDSMKQGRAALEMNNTLRSVSFRLRHDLSNLTIRVAPPADSSTGSGYFEYFDGSMTDYTSTLFDPANTVDPKLQTSMIRSSRFGDLDDILMFTSRAGESWFVGQVPAFVLNPAMLANPPKDSDGDTIDDKFEAVMISSQLAEIVVFTRPVLTNAAVYPYFDDADGNFLPDAYQLHYRALLIRPDLNVNGALPNSDPWLVAADNALGMAPAHQQCDLSIRRVPNGSSADDAVAANSLDDLMNPHNRFAHFEYQLPGNSPSSTMPLLVLEPIPQTPTVVGGNPVPGSAITVFTNDGNTATASPIAFDPDPAGLPPSLMGAAGNFLHPQFALTGVRRGEDILASELLAFDVKGADGGAPILGTNGPDGVAGVSGSGTLGQDGSDDLIMTPNDPGYVAALGSGGATSVAYGAYVDLMWGRKSLAALSYFGATTVSGTPNMFTELSGLASGYTYAPGLIRSGKVLFNTNNTIFAAPILLQPTFDTWTTRYENDGEVQAERAGPIRGVTNFDNYKRMFNASAGGSDLPGQLRPSTPDERYRNDAKDAGHDGLDNNGTGGADDPAELETLPPFPVQLRGIKVSIRIEDRSTRQIRQMSVANEFVTQ